MRNQAFQPRRSDLAAAVSSTEQFRAHGAESHSAALRHHNQLHAGRLTTDSASRALRHGGPLTVEVGAHVGPSTPDLAESYLGVEKSSESAGAQWLQCVGIAAVLLCALTDLPMRLVLAIAEALR